MHFLKEHGSRHGKVVHHDRSDNISHISYYFQIWKSIAHVIGKPIIHSCFLRCTHNDVVWFCVRGVSLFLFFMFKLTETNRFAVCYEIVPIIHARQEYSTKKSGNEIVVGGSAGSLAVLGLGDDSGFHNWTAASSLVSFSVSSLWDCSDTATQSSSFAQTVSPLCGWQRRRRRSTVAT